MTHFENRDQLFDPYKIKGVMGEISKVNFSFYA